MHFHKVMNQVLVTLLHQLPGKGCQKPPHSSLLSLVYVDAGQLKWKHSLDL